MIDDTLLVAYIALMFYALFVTYFICVGLDIDQGGGCSRHNCSRLLLFLFVVFGVVFYGGAVVYKDTGEVETDGLELFHLLARVCLDVTFALFLSMWASILCPDPATCMINLMVAMFSCVVVLMGAVEAVDIFRPGFLSHQMPFFSLYQGGPCVVLAFFSVCLFFYIARLLCAVWNSPVSRFLICRILCLIGACLGCLLLRILTLLADPSHDFVLQFFADLVPDIGLTIILLSATGRRTDTMTQMVGTQQGSAFSTTSELVPRRGVGALLSPGMGRLADPYPRNYGNNGSSFVLRDSPHNTTYTHTP